MRQLVFVHGRSQQNLDPSKLKEEWVSSWEEGLAKSSLKLPIKASEIRFPYYGDTLYQLSRGASEESMARVVIKGSGADTERTIFIAAIVEEMLTKVGVDLAEVREESPEAAERGPLNWAWVLAMLRAIDTVPGCGAASLRLFTNDVYQYVTMAGIMSTIDTGIVGAFTPDCSAVVVGHSLGTVVAYSILRRGHTYGWTVPLFVTLGCPLAVSVIRRHFAPIGHPGCVRRWFNAMDPNDTVALHPLDSSHFGVQPPVENKDDVINESENHHSIRGYLSDSVVARRIYDGVIGFPIFEDAQPARLGVEAPGWPGVRAKLDSGVQQAVDSGQGGSSDWG